MGVCDVNPLNRSLLSSSDEASTMKMLLLKVAFVVVSTALDNFHQLQAGLMVVAMFGVLYYLIERVSKMLLLLWSAKQSHAPFDIKVALRLNMLYNSALAWSADRIITL